MRLFRILGAMGLLAMSLAAQTTTTREVDLSWTASTSSGVTGYTILRGTSAAGPFTSLGTTPTTSYADATAVVGQTYTYEVEATAPACTSTTPTTQACGTSAPSTPATTTVPPTPAAVVTVTVTVP